MHAVAVPGPGPRLTIEAGLGLQLPAECLGALEVLVLRLSVQLPGLVCLVRGAGLVTSLTGGPGALGEAPAEPMLGMSPLIVVREISGHIDKTYISESEMLAYWAPLTVLHLAWHASPVMTFSYQCSSP